MLLIADSPSQVPSGLLASCRTMPVPARILMCPPDAFDVVDVKNPHMQGNIGRVDRTLARRQWDDLKAAFERAGAAVELIPAVPGCEDMVFCANQTFAGLDDASRRVCVLGQMTHASRQREVPAFAEWFGARGYLVRPLPAALGFEGGGDALWHPGRGLIWGGYGHRSVPKAYELVAHLFGVPVVRLRLVSERSYHLDTALCLLDEHTALLNPAALEPHGVELVRGLFRRVIEAPADEAENGLACNAAALPGGHVILPAGNPRTAEALRQAGFQVHLADTSEYLKSGGSVYCMKAYLF